MAKEQIKQAIVEARQTGRVQELRFQKDRILKELPSFNSDPRMMMTEGEFSMLITPMESVSAKELRDMCDANPTHPLAALKRDSVSGLPDATVVHLYRQDLDALRQTVAATTIVVPETVTLKDANRGADEDVSRQKQP